MPRIQTDQERHRRTADFSIRCGLLGCGLARFRRQGHAKRAQGVHRSLPHRRCRIEAAQIHHRALRAGDSSSGAGWQRRRYLQRSSRGVIRRPRNGRRGDEWWQIASRICWKASSRNVCPRTALAARFPGCSVGRWERPWTGRSIHEISKRDVVEVISAIEQRGAPSRRQQDLEIDQDVSALVRGTGCPRSIPGRRRAAALEGSRARPCPGRQRACPGHSRCA